MRARVLLSVPSEAKTRADADDEIKSHPLDQEAKVGHDHRVGTVTEDLLAAWKLGLMQQHTTESDRPKAVAARGRDHKNGQVIGLTKARRRIIVAMLAAGMSKSRIARDLHIHRSTLLRWLRDNPDLGDAVDQAERVLADRCEEEMTKLALAQAPVTAEVKFKALTRIIDRFEAKHAREQGAFSVLELQQALANICSVLEDFPDARAAVIAAYQEGPLSLQEGEHL